MTNQIIKRYQVKGRVLGSKIIQTRETQRLVLLGMMRDDGFIPLLDLDPVWEQDWVKEDVFEFSYTWQGIFVGKDRAWQIEGQSGGKMIPFTPKVK